MRGLQNQNEYNYLSNSSVAKTAVHKRRNISVGVNNSDVVGSAAISNLENKYDSFENI